MRSSEIPLGGSISTHTVNSFFCNFFQNLLSGSRCCTETTGCVIRTTFVEAEAFVGFSDLTASAIARMWAGVGPQHPPRMRTPISAASRANWAKYSGEDLG